MKRTLEELDDNIKNMEEYQRKYFPNDVGVTCPYCGNKLDILHYEYCKKEIE